MICFLLLILFLHAYASSLIVCFSFCVSVLLLLYFLVLLVFVFSVLFSCCAFPAPRNGLDEDMQNRRQDGRNEDILLTSFNSF